MSAANRASKPLPVLLDYSLLKGERIRPPLTPPGDQFFEDEDQGVREMAEKIKETESEISHAPTR